MEQKATHRNRIFDLMRLVFAAMVLLAHAPSLTGHRELLHRITNNNLDFGGVAVAGFFLLSGFLIVKSWQSKPKLGDYLKKRVLRIVPGYLVAALLSTLLAGALLPHRTEFFAGLGGSFWLSLTWLGLPHTPPVWPANAVDHVVNGSMWTIAYEFRCYLLVALCGLLGGFRYRWIWLAGTVLLVASMFIPIEPGKYAFHIATGDPTNLRKLLVPFFIGGCYCLYRVRFTTGLAAAALLVLVALAFVPIAAEPAVDVFGGYLLFYLGSLDTRRHLRWFQNMPDISYGVYLYGWPVECFLIQYVGNPWLVFAASLPVCFLLGSLSWTLVERPMLKLKGRASLPLPAPLQATKVMSPE